MKLISQIVQVADKPNKNNRIYPEKLLQKICDENRGLVEGRSLFGIIGFPENNVIGFGEISHVVTKLFMGYCQDSAHMVADIEILNTPYGKLLQNIIESGTKVSFRLCGVGSIDITKGTTVSGSDVIDEFKLISISAVPSDKAA